MQKFNLIIMTSCVSFFLLYLCRKLVESLKQALEICVLDLRKNKLILILTKRPCILMSH